MISFWSYCNNKIIFLITCIPLTAVDVKLDPATAHQRLEISDNGKKVKDSGNMSTDPDSLQRFDVFGSVLGLNRLSSGRAYWEVEVRNKPGWDLGVARRDANRKGKLSINPDNGYWVVVHYEDQKYAALTTPPVSLSPKRKPQKVGVFVDYEEGLVSFYNVTSRSHIYSFTECSFGGEILPYFNLTFQPCTDCRKVNQVTKMDSFHCHVSMTVWTG
uniref:B30.2/SPRY domain-containing protein n=1 Tax=Neolamprologus brichardi TaxID=32507 RepID=A0A3Q4GW46_NEOBR